MPEPSNSSSNEEKPTLDDQIKMLQKEAIASHQKSVGQGDALVKLLQDAVNQMKSSQGRIRDMSTVFFVFGLIVMGVGVYMALFERQGKEAWGAILGAAGGLASAVTMFYTGPLTKISNAVTNLIKLETAFLGYIRVVGEIDSAFQWQYLERLAGRTVIDISMVSQATTSSMKDIMSHTIQLIDQHVADETPSVMDLKMKVKEMGDRIDELKKAVEKQKNP